MTDRGGMQEVELAPNRASSGGCELTGSYVARCSGMHHLAVVYRGKHIKGSPWQVPHAAHPWPRNSQRDLKLIVSPTPWRCRLLSKYSL